MGLEVVGFLVLSEVLVVVWVELYGDELGDNLIGPVFYVSSCS